MRPDLPLIDWPAVSTALDASGAAVVPGLLDAESCASIRALYPQEAAFRSRVVMARHGYGRGEYQYFSYPLPPTINTLRTQLYTSLAPLANAWYERMGLADWIWGRFSSAAASIVR